MITAVAIDDEPLALDVIKALSAQVDKLKLAATFTETGSALRYLTENPVDLLLLDINMPAVSGIDFYKRVPGHPMVIFTTAYTEYAIEGFNLNAIDYLLKPIDLMRFRKAINKAREYRDFLQHRDLANHRHIYVRADYSMVKVALADIVYIEGLDNYIKIHYDHGKHLLVRMSMKAISEKLPPNEFVRIHRSYIVAVRAVTLVRGKNVQLGTTELPIGANHADEVQQLLQ